jgi:hypothetical protein
VQAELAAPIPAKREDGNWLRRNACLGEQLLDESVHAVRVLAHGVTAPFTAARSGRQLAPRGVEPRGTQDARLLPRIQRKGLGFPHHTEPQLNPRWVLTRQRPECIVVGNPLPE